MNFLAVLLVAFVASAAHAAELISGVPYIVGGDTVVIGTTSRPPFVRIHKTLRTTPATAAGVTKRLWEVGNIWWRSSKRGGRAISNDQELKQ
jgi:hypothetical protein